MKNIRSEEAKRQILEDTDLQEDQITVMTLLSSHFRYLSRETDVHTITESVYFEAKDHTQSGDIWQVLQLREEDIMEGEGVTGQHEATDEHNEQSVDSTAQLQVPSEAVLCVGCREDPGCSEACKCLRASAIGGFLETDNGTQYIITSGHYSTEDTKYYFDRAAEKEIGRCRYHFFDSETDVAFVRLDPIPKEKLRNVLSFPMKDGAMKTFVPMISEENLADRARGEHMRVFKYSPQGLLGGKLAHMSVKDASNNVFQYLTVDAPDWSGGICAPGDSGSIIFSITDPSQPYVQVHGLVAGLLTTEMKDGGIKNVCVMSPLWPAIKRIQEQQREEGGPVDNFKFISPVEQLVSTPTNTLSPPARRQRVSAQNLAGPVESRDPVEAVDSAQERPASRHQGVRHRNQSSDSGRSVCLGSEVGNDSQREEQQIVELSGVHHSVHQQSMRVDDMNNGCGAFGQGARPRVIHSKESGVRSGSCRPTKLVSSGSDWSAERKPGEGAAVLQKSKSQGVRGAVPTETANVESGVSNSESILSSGYGTSGAPPTEDDPPRVTLSEDVAWVPDMEAAGLALPRVITAPRDNQGSWRS